MASYVLFLIIVMTIAYYSAWSAAMNQSMQTGQSLVNLDLGGTLFKTLVWTQTILLALIVPSLTSGAISQELEKRTIEMLALTRLTPGKIVIGKHLAGIMYPLVLMICSLPLSGICVMLGGISPAEILVAYLALAAWGFLLAAVGLYWSSMFKRTASAALFSYGMSGIYFLFTFYVVLMLSFGPGGGSVQSAFWMLNPGMASTMGILEKTTVCGLKIYAIFPAILIHLIFGTILILASSTHVKYYKADRALPIRILLMIVTGLMIWLYAGKASVSYAATSPSDNYLFYLMGMILYMMCLFAAIIATGTPDLSQKKIPVLYGFSLRKAFSGDLSGSMMFMVIYTIFVYVVMILTIKWNSAAGGYIKGTVSLIAILSVSIANIAVIMGISALAVFFSSVIKKRAIAGICTALITLLILAGYNIVLLIYNAWLSGSSSPIWQIAAFWPITPLLALRKDMWNNMPHLWWSRGSAWIVCSVVYMIIIVLLLKLAAKAAKKNPAVEED
jgi:ABC-type transport system involved in multi-copper enzyme maturation permease subunit